MEQLHNNPKENQNPLRSREYNNVKIRMTIADIIIDLVLIAILAFSGISRWIVSYISDTGITGNYFIFLAFLGIAGIANSILSLPSGFYSGYIIEHRYGLSNQTLLQWIWERLKSALLGIAIGLPVALLFFYLLKTAGDFWWLFFSGTVFFFAVVMARIAPVLIFPLFYTFRPLANNDLTERIHTLMVKHGIVVKGIFSFNLSKNTKKANAGFTGIGKSRRVILSDTLLENFTSDEIMVIFSHELGHYLKRHIIKNIIMSGVIIFLSFYICNFLYNWTRLLYGFLNPADIAALPILLFYLTITGTIIMPLTNAISRKFEREADHFAVSLTHDPESFISGMEKLADINLADLNPHPLIEFLFYSHPSIGKRIAFGKQVRDTL